MSGWLFAALKNAFPLVANTCFDGVLAALSCHHICLDVTYLPASAGRVLPVRRFDSKKFKKLSKMDDLNTWYITLRFWLFKFIPVFRHAGFE